MIPSTRFTTVTLLAAISASGCATYLNVCDVQTSPPGQGDSITPVDGRWEASKEVYGGVRTDAAFGTGMLVNEVFVDPWAVPLGLTVLLIDLPLSAVGDTLTLPITVPAASDRYAKREDSTEPAPVP